MGRGTNRDVHIKDSGTNHVLVCVCCFVLLNQYWESLCRVPGLHCERAKGDAPTIRDRRRLNLTLSTNTWGVWILTLTLTTSLATPVSFSSS